MIIKSTPHSTNVSQTMRLSLQDKYGTVMSEILESLANGVSKHTISLLSIFARSTVRSLPCLDKFEQFYRNSSNLIHVLLVFTYAY